MISSYLSLRAAPSLPTEVTSAIVTPFLPSLHTAPSLPTGAISSMLPLETRQKAAASQRQYGWVNSGRAIPACRGGGISGGTSGSRSWAGRTGRSMASRTSPPLGSGSRSGSSGPTIRRSVHAWPAGLTVCLVRSVNPTCPQPRTLTHA